MSETTSVLTAQGLIRTYRQGDQQINVLKGAELAVAAGEMVAVVGRSGSGKSTLLHVLAGLDTPQAGSVTVAGVDLVSASPNRRASVRAAHMGFVYQNHHLLGEFCAWENVAVPLRIRGDSRQQSKAAALELLNDVGLAERVEHFPAQLSGGERQRVAVARAVAGAPAIVLADEPTGNLDKENAVQTMALIRRLATGRQTSFLVVTHDEGMLHHFDRILRLDGGQLHLV